MLNFKIIICSKFYDCKEEYNQYLSKYNNISYHFGDFIELENQFDCIVSSGNSYGLMDGGLDGAINRYIDDIDNFNNYIQSKLIKKVGGYNQEGNCVLIQLPSKKCNYLAHCSTMHIPTIITDLKIIYNCYWNLIAKIYKYNNPCINRIKIKNVVCCPLGTGVGNVSHNISLQLLNLAIENFINVQLLSKTNNYIINWEYANNQYAKITNKIKELEINNNKPDMYDLINIKRINSMCKENKTNQEKNILNKSIEDIDNYMLNELLNK